MADTTIGGKTYKDLGTSDSAFPTNDASTALAPGQYAGLPPVQTATTSPAVITSNAATTDLNNIKTNVNDINTSITNQAATVGAQDAADKVVADKAAADKLAADQKAEELRIKNAALNEGGDTTTTTQTPEEIKLANAEQDYYDTATNVSNTIKNIQNGSIPLNAGEKAQVDGLRAQFQQLIDQQKLTNIGNQGYGNIRGYQTGGAEHDPTFQTKVIGTIITAGLNKVANLNIQMASAVASLTQGFKNDDINAIKDAWTVYKDASKNRTDALSKTIADANAKIKEANDLAEKQRVEGIAVTKDINTVASTAAKNFAPPEVLAKINAAKTVGEAMIAAGKYIGDEGEVLDREYKRAQIDEARANTAKIIADNAANSPVAVAAKAQSAVLDNITLVDSVLNSPYLSQVTGLKNPFTYWTPGSNEQYVKAQLAQVINSLSLENRQKLKGQGAVSDFEGRMLAKASSSLTPSLSDADAKKELHKIRGIFSTAAGFTATVKMTAPNGESKVLEADRAGIDQAIIDGLTVEYQ